MTFNKLNILQNFKKENYSSFPYPFLEIDNALPQDIYEMLKSEYNIFDNYFKSQNNFYENNKRIQINTEEILQNENSFKKSIV